VPAAASVRIDVASIDTREPQRDAHLRSADFFDIEKFGEITFESTRVEGDEERFTMYGDLTIHGVTREVALEGTLDGRGKDPWGGERVAYEAHAKISRKDFGLTWNQVLEAGGVAVSDDVRIELNVEAVLSV
jgi:polyisoprenoid-binding protein YceI